MKLKGEKIHILMYADDVAVKAKEEQDMRSIMRRLEKYLNMKGLMLSNKK